MGERRVLKLEELFDMVTWAPNEEKFCVDLMIDHAMNGKLFDAGCQSDVLKEIASKLSTCFGKQFSYTKVLKKFESLKKRYKNWEVVTFWHGVRFNVSDNRCEASDATWEAIIKEHPYAKKYRNEGEKLWCELSLIFGGQSSTDNLKSQLKLNHQKSNTVIVISETDDDESVGHGVHDKGSTVGCYEDNKISNASFGRNDGKGKSAQIVPLRKVKQFTMDDNIAHSGASSIASSYWPKTEPGSPNKYNYA